MNWKSIAGAEVAQAQVVVVGADDYVFIGPRRIAAGKNGDDIVSALAQLSQINLERRG